MHVAPERAKGNFVGGDGRRNSIQELQKLQELQEGNDYWSDRR